VLNSFLLLSFTVFNVPAEVKCVKYISDCVTTLAAAQNCLPLHVVDVKIAVVDRQHFVFIIMVHFP